MTWVDRRGAIVALGLGIAGASAWSRVAAAARYDDPDALYAALREQRGERLSFPGGEINLVFADGAPGVDRAATRRWIRRNADAMTLYFGRFPVRSYGLLVIAEPGAGVGHATTFGYAGPATRIHVGVGAREQAFLHDWVMAHEMLHAALPDMPRRALWLQEGNATWLEPVARVQAGQLAEAELWRQAVIGMPRGEPDADGGGMDGTRDHERLYWGGATFWLLAEIAIDRSSNGRRSLRDALRAINRQSGGIGADWTPEQLMAAGDAAAGSDALSTLYRQFATERVATDLPALFRSLGVALFDGAIRFDNEAPLAPVRQRIVQRR